MVAGCSKCLGYVGLCWDKPVEKLHRNQSFSPGGQVSKIRLEEVRLAGTLSLQVRNAGPKCSKLFQLSTGEKPSEIPDIHMPQLFHGCIDQRALTDSQFGDSTMYH